MTAVVLIIHLLLAMAMIGLVLIQKSEGGGLGIGGGGGGGMGGFMTGRATTNLLTRATAILAALFFATSLTLALLADSRSDGGSILDQGGAPPAEHGAPQDPAAAAAPPAPRLPAVPTQ